MIFLCIIIIISILMYIYTLQKYKKAKRKGEVYKGLKPIHVIIIFAVILVAGAVFHDSNIIYKGERLIGTYQSVENDNERLKIYKFDPRMHSILIEQKIIDPVESTIMNSGVYVSNSDYIELNEVKFNYEYNGDTLKLIDANNNIKEYKKIAEENVELDKNVNYRINDDKNEYKPINKDLMINADYQIYHNDESWKLKYNSILEILIEVDGNNENIKIENVSISFDDSEFTELESVYLLINKKFDNENIAKLYSCSSSTSVSNHYFEHYQFTFKDELISEEEVSKFIDEMKIKIIYSEGDSESKQRIVSLKNFR